jgi:hypothetical protein
MRWEAKGVTCCGWGWDGGWRGSGWWWWWRGEPARAARGRTVLVLAFHGRDRAWPSRLPRLARSMRGPQPPAPLPMWATRAWQGRGIVRHGRRTRARVSALERAPSARRPTPRRAAKKTAALDDPPPARRRSAGRKNSIALSSTPSQNPAHLVLDDLAVVGRRESAARRRGRRRGGGAGQAGPAAAQQAGRQAGGEERHGSFYVSKKGSARPLAVAPLCSLLRKGRKALDGERCEAKRPRRDFSTHRRPGALAAAQPCTPAISRPWPCPWWPST